MEKIKEVRLAKMTAKVHAADGEKNVAQKRMSAENSANIEGVIHLGWHTVFICVIAELMVLSQLGNMFYMVYAGAAPSIIGCGDHKFSSELDSVAVCKQLHLIKQNETCRLELQYDFESVNVEFGYFCQDARYVKDSISVQMLGVIAGSLFFGQISDSYGRKPTLVLTLLGCTIFALISAFPSDLILLTVYRSALGFFNGGQMSTLLVYVIENIPKKDRVWITGVVLSWTPNISVFAVIAYLSGNWRTLAISTSVLTLPALALCLAAFESPRWLIQRGRLEDAHRVLLKISKMNGRSGVNNKMIDDVISREKEMLRDLESNRRGYYVYHLFNTRTLATYTLILAYSFMTASIINYGLLFNMEELSGSIYVNNIVLSMIRFAINIVSAFVDYTIPWFGRRMAHTVPLFLACTGFTTGFIIMATGFTLKLQLVLRIATLLAFSVSSQVYVTNGVVANELFPTQIRAISFAFLQVISRMGVVIAPQLFFIGELWTAAPYLAMLLFALLDMVLYLIFIPETKGRPLRDRLSVTKESAAFTVP